MIVVECHQCGKRFALRDKYAGKLALCMCGQRLRVQIPEVASTTQANADFVLVDQATEKRIDMQSSINARASALTNIGLLMLEFSGLMILLLLSGCIFLGGLAMCISAFSSP